MSTEAHIFQTEILDDIAASVLTDFIINGDVPTVVFGPGDDIHIAFNIDQTVSNQWDTLILTPSPNDPPRWLARLTNIIEDRQISSNPEPDSTEPSHETLPEALAALAARIGADSGDAT